MIRKIYMIEVCTFNFFTGEGGIKYRGYARNKKTANKIAKNLLKRVELPSNIDITLEATIQLLRKEDWNWIDLNWVE